MTNIYEQNEPQTRSFERHESKDKISYDFRPLITMEEYARNPKYDKLLDFNMALLRGHGGITYSMGLKLDGTTSNFVGLELPKSTSREAASAMFRALKIAGIVDMESEVDKYAPYPRTPLTEEEISVIRVIAANKSEGSLIIPTCEANYDDSLIRFGYKIVDPAGNEIGFQPAPTRQHEKTNATDLAVYGLSRLGQVLSEVMYNVEQGRFEHEHKAFVPYEVEHISAVFDKFVAE